MYVFGVFFNCRLTIFAVCAEVVTQAVEIGPPIERNVLMLPNVLCRSVDLIAHCSN